MESSALKKNVRKIFQGISITVVTLTSGAGFSHPAETWVAPGILTPLPHEGSVAGQQSESPLAKVLGPAVGASMKSVTAALARHWLDPVELSKFGIEEISDNLLKNAGAGAIEKTSHWNPLVKSLQDETIEAIIGPYLQDLTSSEKHGRYVYILPRLNPEDVRRHQQAYYLGGVVPSDGFVAVERSTADFFTTVGLKAAAFYTSNLMKYGSTAKVEPAAGEAGPNFLRRASAVFAGTLVYYIGEQLARGTLGIRKHRPLPVALMVDDAGDLRQVFLRPAFVRKPEDRRVQTAFPKLPIHLVMPEGTTLGGLVFPSPFSQNWFIAHATRFAGKLAASTAKFATEEAAQQIFPKDLTRPGQPHDPLAEPLNNYFASKRPADMSSTFVKTYTKTYLKQRVKSLAITQPDPSRGEVAGLLRLPETDGGVSYRFLYKK